MDPLSMIVTALALGAAAGLKANAESAVKDAYIGLKTLIQKKYAEVNVNVIEKAPASQSRREVLAEDLSKAQADKDEEVLAKARKLVETISSHDPGVAQTIGVDLMDIQGTSLTIQEVEATGNQSMGVRVKKADIKGDISIRDVRAGGTKDQEERRKTGKSSKKPSGRNTSKK